MVNMKTLRQTLLITCVLILGLCNDALCIWGAEKETSTPKVTAEIDLYKTFANHPIQGTISVTHNNNVPVDASSFRMDGNPLKVVATKTVKLSPNNPLEISFYRFTLPGKPQGLYVLPEISVSVGGKVYRSFQTTYEVTGAEPRAIADVATLRMEASVEGATPLYPGQRARFIYRFYFTGNIELMTEFLPLLEATGFLKIGDKQIIDFVEGGVSVEEAVQEVQAIKPGDFQFPASYIEGYAYHEDIMQKRIYQQMKLRAETQPMTVTVAAFPEVGKPPSFNGAVGQYTMQASLLTRGEITVDNKIELAIDITGTGELSTVLLPDLKTVLQGALRLSDLPSVGEVKGQTKRFIVELYPLSTAIAEIPSIEFSFFDPQNNRYTTIQSIPIPIKVVPAAKKTKKTSAEKEPAPLREPLPAKETPSPPAKEKAPTKESVPIKESAPAKEDSQAKIQEQMHPLQTFLSQPEAIEIEGNYPLTSSNLRPLVFGTWGVFWLIPLGILLILLQLGYQQYVMQQKKIVKPKSSEQVFQELLQTPPKTPKFYQLLNQAFLMRLVEKGELKSADLPPEQLSKEGVQGSVRAFLCDVEQKRFAGKEEGSVENLLKEAYNLFKRLRQ